MSLKDAIDRFLEWRAFSRTRDTIKGYNGILRQFAVFMKNCELEDIALVDIMEWYQLQKKFGWDEKTFVGRSSALRTFFSFYIKQGFRVVDPMLIPMPRVIPQIPRSATDEQYKKLISVIPKDGKDPRHVRNLAIVNLLWDTGARIGEVRSLDERIMDYHNKRAVIKTEKSRGFRPLREIFWTEETNKNILRWVERKRKLAKKMQMDERSLFVNIAANSGSRLSSRGIGDALRSYSRKANINPYLNAHSFRHHMGHDIIRKGGSNADVMNILGHAKIDSSTIYTMMFNKELEDRYRKFKGR